MNRFVKFGLIASVLVALPTFADAQVNIDVGLGGVPTPDAAVDVCIGAACPGGGGAAAGANVGGAPNADAAVCVGAACPGGGGAAVGVGAGPAGPITGDIAVCVGAACGGGVPGGGNPGGVETPAIGILSDTVTVCLDALGVAVVNCPAGGDGGGTVFTLCLDALGLPVTCLPGNGNGGGGGGGGNGPNICP